MKVPIKLKLMRVDKKMQMPHERRVHLVHPKLARPFLQEKVDSCVLEVEAVETNRKAAAIKNRCQNLRQKSRRHHGERGENVLRCPKRSSRGVWTCCRVWLFIGPRPVIVSLPGSLVEITGRKHRLTEHTQRNNKRKNGRSSTPCSLMVWSKCTPKKHHITITPRRAVDRASGASSRESLPLNRALFKLSTSAVPDLS